MPLKNFIVALVSFLVLDGLWLGLVAKNFNLRQLREIGRIENGTFELQYLPAALAYLLMALAVAAFARLTWAGDPPYGHTFAWGALLGLVVFGVFDLTNLAILKNYPLAFALVDMAWGTFAFGAVSVITRKFS